MAYKKNRISFHAEVESKVRLSFQKQWKNRNQGNNEATTAALKLWVSLPRELQGLLLHCDFDTDAISHFLSRRLREALSKALLLEEPPEPPPEEKRDSPDDEQSR